jgi:hypothetical protein
MWSLPDERRHPTVFAAKAVLRAAPPALYIDFHGHSRMNGTFAYGCPATAADANGRERLFPKLIAMLSDAFTLGNCTFSMPLARLTASRCVARVEMGVAESFCIETSFCGVGGGRLASVLYDEYLWKDVGARIAEAAFHLLACGASRIRLLAERALGLVSRRVAADAGLSVEEERLARTSQALVARADLRGLPSSLPAIRAPGKGRALA